MNFPFARENGTFFRCKNFGYIVYDLPRERLNPNEQQKGR